jgi:hypothetical protein
MIGMKWRSILLAGVVLLATTAFVSEKTEAGWGYGFYRPPVVRSFRPRVAYRPVVRAYRPVITPVPYMVPVPRPVYGPAVPYRSGYRGYSPYYSGYGYGGVSVNLGYGVAPVGYIGY